VVACRCWSAMRIDGNALHYTTDTFGILNSSMASLDGGDGASASRGVEGRLCFGGVFYLLCDYWWHGSAYMS
jgi:hypothetical protein